MRRFDWKIAIVSLVLFSIPIVAYPASGVLQNGVATYSYGLPFSWLSFHFASQGGRLFVFQIFGSDTLGYNIDGLTAILNLLILYFVILALVRVFWTNHFALKRAERKEDRKNQEELRAKSEAESETEYNED